MKEYSSTLAGMRLKKIRGIRGVTQEELGLACECNPSHISNFERGRSGLSVNSLATLCRTLDVSADYLLFGVDDVTLDKLRSQILVEVSSADEEALADVLRYIRFRKYSGIL